MPADGAQVNLVRPRALCKPGAVSIRPCKPLLKEVLTELEIVNCYASI